MKKLIVFLITAAMLCVCMAGCGSTGNNAKDNNAPAQDATTTQSADTTTAQAADESTVQPAEGTTAQSDTDQTKDGETWENVFESWNEEAPALKTLVDYVENVTDESSKDFIPVEKRVAVFDMDGTIYAELFPTYFEYYMFAWRVLADPKFTPDQDMLQVAEDIYKGGPTHTYDKDMAIKHATQAARAYAGMTLDEFSDYVTEVLLRDADGFTGMTYGEAFYQPIIEVIEYLQDHDFDVYVVSGSDRFICRTLFEGIVDIPDENFIGMDVGLAASGEGDVDGLDYMFAPTDQLIRTDKLIVKNLKMNKVTAIVREIGKQPVLSFGNTSGDYSMHMYTISNNPYKSAAFMLIADDDQRDYGHPEKAQELRTEWETAGFNVISMKNDFKTIYGENVKKTGKFHWSEELTRK